MKDSETDSRSLIERTIDRILKDPKEMEKNIRWALGAQGIEPNLETVLSFITGTVWGGVCVFLHFRYNRTMNSDEQEELIELLQRRAFELRQAFVSTRIEE